MGHVHLDPISAIIELLARSFASFYRTIDQLRTLWNRDLRRISLERITARGGDRECRDKHSWPRDISFIYGALDADIAVPRALGFHVTDGSEALLERASRGNCGARCAICQWEFQQLHIVAAGGGVFALQENVSVRIN